ncbi:MAG: hypothetical protein WCJ60_02075 [bacterium]
MNEKTKLVVEELKKAKSENLTYAAACEILKGKGFTDEEIIQASYNFSYNTVDISVDTGNINYNPSINEDFAKGVIKSEAIKQAKSDVTKTFLLSNLFKRGPLGYFFSMRLITESANYEDLKDENSTLKHNSTSLKIFSRYRAIRSFTISYFLSSVITLAVLTPFVVGTLRALNTVYLFTISFYIIMCFVIGSLGLLTTSVVMFFAKKLSTVRKTIYGVFIAQLLIFGVPGLLIFNYGLIITGIIVSLFLFLISKTVGPLAFITSIEKLSEPQPAFKLNVINNETNNTEPYIKGPDLIQKIISDKWFIIVPLISLVVVTLAILSMFLVASSKVSFLIKQDLVLIIIPLSAIALSAYLLSKFVVSKLYIAILSSVSGFAFALFMIFTFTSKFITSKFIDTLHLNNLQAQLLSIAILSLAYLISCTATMFYLVKTISKPMFIHVVFVIALCSVFVLYSRTLGTTIYNKLTTTEKNNLKSSQIKVVDSFNFTILLPTYLVEGYSKYNIIPTKENVFNFTTYEVEFISKGKSLVNSYRVIEFPMSGQPGPATDCSYVSNIKKNTIKDIYKNKCKFLARSTLGCDVYIYLGISGDELFCEYKGTAIVVSSTMYHALPNSELIKVIDSMKPASAEELIM